MIIEKPPKKFQLGEGWRFASTRPGLSRPTIKPRASDLHHHDDDDHDDDCDFGDGDDDDGGNDSYDDRADRGSPGMQRQQKIGILSAPCNHLQPLALLQAP